MNLIIDIGNTVAKCVVFDGNDVAEHQLADNRTLDGLVQLAVRTRPQRAILSSVVPLNSDMRRRLALLPCPLTELTHATPVPIRNGYRTPQTLGRDRIATAVGAWSIAQRLDNACDVLVIDAGTAITYDLVTANGCFVGGNIAPGLRLRFKSLHEHTGRLPLINAEGDTPVVGYDTETAIRSGVLLGLLGEIRCYIHDLKLSHPNLMVFITGGDGRLLHQRLDDDSIIYYEHLAAEGLNRIYLYNKANENR
jgi:type III pantothenate kinase